MNRTLLLILAALAMLWVFPGRSDPEDAPRLEKMIDRFQEVAPGLYRGGQPTRAGFEALKQRGVRTIINLREEHDERELIEGLGLKYVYIPLDAWDPVSDRSIKDFFDAVNEPANQPVFVHCRRGADRTGFMIGLYRIAQQGWSAKQAYHEARELGMRWWYRGLKNQLFAFDEQRAGARTGGQSPATAD
jgi:protein tyrosine/serine phosphatase